MLQCVLTARPNESARAESDAAVCRYTVAKLVSLKHLVVGLSLHLHTALLPEKNNILHFDGSGCSQRN